MSKRILLCSLFDFGDDMNIAMMHVYLNPNNNNLHDSELDETHGRGVVKSHGLEVLTTDVTRLKFGLLVPTTAAGPGLGLDLGGLGISRSLLGIKATE